MKILLVEDDELIGNAISQVVQDSGHACDWLKNGQQVLAATEVDDYALMLLDLGLPGKNGFQVLREIRQRKDSLPVIIITARDAVEDKIQGLDLGADDYLVKPFSVDELNARIRAVLRRGKAGAVPLLEAGGIVLNPATREVSKSGKLIKVSAREYSVLYTMLSQAGKVFSRDKLEEQVYGWNEEVASNAIEFLIHGLRRKLGKSAITNIRGLGWVIKEK